MIGATLTLVLGVGVGTAPLPEGKAHVVTDVLRSISALPRGELQEVFVRFRGDELRIDFQDARGRDFALLRPRGSAVYVLMDSRGGALPVPGAALPLVFDSGAPCGSLGILSECSRLGDGVHAGRNAVRWQYRRANRGGPGGTDSGTMWLDRDTGFVLEYDARSRGGSEHRTWDVVDIDYGTVEPSWFALPAAPKMRANANANTNTNANASANADPAEGSADAGSGSDGAD